MRNGSNGRGGNGKAGNGGELGVVRCAVYCRRSVDETNGNGAFNSTDAQREACLSYISSQKGQGWVPLAEPFVDTGFSGGNTARPALTRLLADVEAGKLDAIVCYKLDRLSRSLLDFLNIHKTLEAHGVNLVSVTEPINTQTPMGRAFLSILISFGQMEREVTAERTRDKVHAARRRGKFVGGALIIGYDRHPDGGRLLVNEAEAERVRAIFQMFIDHPSIIGVVEELNRRGWTLKRWTTRDAREYGGGPFDKYNLKRLLTNHAYVGEVAFDGQVVPGEHQGLVDRETWDAVQAALATNGHEQARTGRPSTALLGGLLYCAPCDRAMSPTFSQRGSRRYRYYLCQRAGRQGWASCPSKSVPASEIEQFVVDRIRAIGSDPGLITATADAARQLLTARRRELESEIQRLRDQVGQVHSDLRKQLVDLSRDSLGCPRPAQPEQQSEIQTLEDRLAAAQSELAALRGQRIDAADLRAALAAFDPVWDHLTSHERQRVVRLLIDRIDYDGTVGKIVISFSAVRVQTLATESGVQTEARA